MRGSLPLQADDGTVFIGSAPIGGNGGQRLPAIARGVGLRRVQPLRNAAACDTARCASAFTSTFPNSAYVSRVLQAAENAARTCAADRPIVQQPAPAPEPTPPPQVNYIEQAARNFVVRYYFTSSSQGEADGASLSALFASQVSFYGKQTSSAEIMREKLAYNTRWDRRRFVVSYHLMNVTCNSSGENLPRDRLCRVGFQQFIAQQGFARSVII